MTMAERAKPAVIVTLSGERQVRDVARDLRAAGLEIDQVLEETGIVTGTADSRTHATLRRIQGVADVSGDHPINIGPPDSDVQ
jgi:hypothetical protein